MNIQNDSVVFSDAQIKQLRQVIREEVEIEAKDIKVKIFMDQLGLKKGLFDMNNRLKNMEIENSHIQQGLKDTKQEILDALENTTHIIMKHISEGFNLHEERISTIEKRIELITPN